MLQISSEFRLYPDFDTAEILEFALDETDLVLVCPLSYDSEPWVASPWVGVA